MTKKRKAVEPKKIYEKKGKNDGVFDGKKKTKTKRLFFHSNRKKKKKKYEKKTFNNVNS